MAQTMLQSRHRNRLLTNSAAEFVETRTDKALGLEFGQQTPEFVPELDSFAAPTKIIIPDYYQESKQKLEQFQQTLSSFHATISSNKLHQKYGLDLQASYTIDDVITIAKKIQRTHQESGEVKTCMGQIRKFFRASGKNASSLQRFLEFVPNGDYTAPICGGFTVILSSLERMETLRTDMYSALAEVPKTMSRIDRRLRVHFQSERLKHCADMIWVAIFTLLEAIIRELSASSGRKVMKVLLKGEDYAKNVDAAIADLKACVSEFESEANTCDSKRLGQVNCIAQETLATARSADSGIRLLVDAYKSSSENSEKVQKQLAEDRASLAETQAKFLAATDSVLGSKNEILARQNEVRSQEVQVNVCNNFYFFLTASPSFDKKTGTLDKMLQAGGTIIRSSTPLSVEELMDANPALSVSPAASILGLSPTRFSPIPRPDNYPVAKAWLNTARNPHRVANNDLRACLADITATPTVDAQDQIGYILASDELRAWLRTPKSQLLAVKLFATDCVEYTPASYAAAVLARCLQRSAPSPTLTHFCDSRDNDPYNNSLIGGTGMLVSLIGQLVAHIRDRRDDWKGQKQSFMDLTFLESQRKSCFEVVSTSVSKLLRLLKRLFQLLSSTSETVYIILDSIWKLQTPGDDNAKRALKGLLIIAADLFKAARRDQEGNPSVILKIVITEPFSSEQLYDDVFFDEDQHDSGYERKRSRKGFDRGFYNSLFVPEDVPGGNGVGINTDWVEEEVHAMILEYSEGSSGTQTASTSSESESESESEWTDRSDRRAVHRRSEMYGQRQEFKAKKGRHSHGASRRSASFLVSSDSDEDGSVSESE